MSKDKAEEKARAIQARTERLKLISKIPLIKSNILYIAESGSINGSLMLSIEKLMDNYTESLSTENAQLREALREAMQALTDISDPIAYLRIKMPKDGYSFDLRGAVEFANNGMSISCMAKDALSKLENKAKQLLTDNTKEDEKE